MNKVSFLKLITNSETINVQEEIPGLIFLDAKQEYPIANSNSIEIKGIDGELPGSITYSSFNLIIRLGFDGFDSIDSYLAEDALRKLFFRREYYYIITSDSPNKKYAVENPQIAPSVKDSSTIEFELTFKVYKGYSESLYLTDQFSLGDGKWQFENGLVPDSDIKYKHTRTLFEIFNGSSDTIDPRHSHKLKIRIRLATETGFKIINKKTGDVFEYIGELKANQSFLIDGGYPYKDQKRCGRQTNHGIIRLAPGYNTFEVWGKISKFEIEFVFPFIYR
ncbi:phage tail protein [Staphylococcus casei]|uniref:phage tail domain-containing protein n=1 Tax=Staphylococcus casei TaxID=201828 RepID=UPI000CD04A9F|nr:phage tail domain-containing protein [Staphylococcus casei]PNZ60946.1 phage tail protein [Staphylococcus casei]WJE87434.1 phage tail family protein [Staphylococcus casei]